MPPCPQPSAQPPPREPSAALTTLETASAGANSGQITAGTAAENIVEVDPVANLDDDEGYQADAQSTKTTSISSSVRDHVFENNRRYHKYNEGHYLIPNDDEEQEREDMKHALVLHLCGGKLHLAPLTILIRSSTSALARASGLLTVRLRIV